MERKSEYSDLWSIPHYFYDTPFGLIRNMITDFCNIRMLVSARNMLFIVKEVYEHNPSFETAALLARIGIPKYVDLEVLDPAPSTRQTPEDAVKLAPLVQLLDKIDDYVEQFSKTIFLNYFNTLARSDPEIEKLAIRKFQVTVATPSGREFELYVNNLTRGGELRNMIADAINTSPGSLVQGDVAPNRLAIILNSGGLKQMELDKTLGDYGIKAGSKITVQLIIKSGLRGGGTRKRTRKQKR
jgi:hypothetical protein